MTNTSCCC